MKEKVCRRLWVFDFDGTLSTLVPNRHSALLHAGAADLLHQLVANPHDRVAVLSSRALDDLISRIPIPQLFIGGGSGLEWHLPGGERLSPGKDEERDLEAVRLRALPALEWIGSFPGVELEDKRWSIAVHYRRVLPEKMHMLSPLIAVLKRLQEVRLFEGPFVTEVQFLPKGNKYHGVRKLCRMLDFDPSAGQILYAGDDENDAAAMRWVLSQKGSVYVVGDRVRVDGAEYVDGPAALVRSLLALTNSADRTG